MSQQTLLNFGIIAKSKKNEVPDKVDITSSIPWDSSTVDFSKIYDSVNSFEECLEPHWRSILHNEFKQPYLAQILSALKTEESKGVTIYPPKEKILNAFNSCPFDKVKVVIIGQDPYHEPGQACGLSFSVPKGIPTPKSLINMYKDLEISYPGEFRRPNHGCLESWCNQGVLLLNAALTVPKGDAHGHKKLGWDRFTKAAISAINSKANGVVFLAWGRDAQALCTGIDLKKHRLLKTVHPSPLAQNGPVKFIGSETFKKANEILMSEFGKSPINWCSVCN